MASEKEIRAKIASVGKTQKITKAMEMVAASKMRKAQERMAASRPYAEKIRAAIGHVANAQVEYRHPYLVARPTVKSVGFVMVSTDRGLCGGLNVNLIKTGVTAIRKWLDQQVAVKVTAIGSKAAVFFRRFGNLVSESTHLGATPRLDDVVGAIKTMLDAYDNGQLDRLYLVENQFCQHDDTKAACRPAVASRSVRSRRSRRRALGLHL